MKVALLLTMSAMSYSMEKDIPHPDMLPPMEVVIAGSNISSHKHHREEHKTIEEKDGKIIIDVLSDSTENNTTYTKRTLLLSNGITATVMTLVGSGVTLAIKYGLGK